MGVKEPCKRMADAIFANNDAASSHTAHTELCAQTFPIENNGNNANVLKMYSYSTQHIFDNVYLLFMNKVNVNISHV